MRVASAIIQAMEESFATGENLGDKVEKARDALHVEEASSAPCKWSRARNQIGCFRLVSVRSNK